MDNKDRERISKQIKDALQTASNQEPQISESQLRFQTEYVVGGTSKVIDDVDPEKDKILGLWTAGASTCTVVTGFFTNKEGRYGLFLSHVLPGKNLGRVFYDLPISEVNELYYTIISGPAVDAKKPISSGLTEITGWLQLKGIQARSLPEKSERKFTHSTQTKFYKTGLDSSVDVIVKIERENDSFIPKVTTVWNR